MSRTCGHGQEIIWNEAAHRTMHFDPIDNAVTDECLPEIPTVTPQWAHRLLDAFLTGEPLNFGGELPPPDIRERLDRAAADGTLGKVRA